MTKDHNRQKDCLHNQRYQITIIMMFSSRYDKTTDDLLQTQYQDKTFKDEQGKFP